MSFTNPVPGDIQYAQFAIVTTVPIKESVNIEKGSCFTIDPDGYLVDLVGASDALTNLNGIFQAMASSVSVSGESSGDRRVQVLNKRSRILIKAPADVTKGDSVTIAVTGTAVTADKIEVSAANIIGTVFEVAAITSDRRPKVKTANNDLVLVDLIE